MSVAFDDVRLPIEIEQGSTGGPTFNTSIVRLGSGAEARNQNWQSQRVVYDVGYGLTSSAQTDAQDFYTLLQFFYARRGRFRGFRFKDWTDFEAFSQPMLPNTGNLVWQLQKVYSDGVQTYTRKLTRPVAGSVVVFHADNSVVDPSSYTLDVTKGTVTFTSSQSGLKATCQFDVPVRFDTDTFTLTVQLFNAAEVQSLAIVEVIE